MVVKNPVNPNVDYDFGSLCSHLITLGFLQDQAYAHRFSLSDTNLKGVYWLEFPGSMRLVATWDIEYMLWAAKRAKDENGKFIQDFLEDIVKGAYSSKSQLLLKMNISGF